ncbi:hypothetical protein K461DRAFT_313499 [Myriangium duriaei CBS 260.36]|uniref:Uncharacterized protein n=1 Tax=Myriangium duriaei CBS 260.36 TaxID=1168546 RepID=A0A9P4J029_9PEZI|nr:hypothetical protein K461DRAFT_313499 [Myriangium duriaei CBS 260.36]
MPIMQGPENVQCRLRRTGWERRGRLGTTGLWLGQYLPGHCCRDHSLRLIGGREHSMGGGPRGHGEGLARQDYARRSSGVECCEHEEDVYSQTGGQKAGRGEQTLMTSLCASDAAISQSMPMPSRMIPQHPIAMICAGHLVCCGCRANCIRESMDMDMLV